MPQFMPDQCTFGDVPGMGFWDNEHAREHMQIAQLLAQRNISVAQPDLLCFLTGRSGRASLAQSHFALHQQLREATGVGGVDLGQVNFDDQGDFYSWLGYHATEHAQLRQVLGIV